MHRPINLINIEQSLKQSVKKMQQTCFRVQNSSWTYDKGFKHL